MAVRPFRCRENPLRHRPTHSTTEALELVHSDRTLALTHQSKARTADGLERIPDPKGTQALKPCRQAIDTKATQRHLETELHARRQLLTGMRSISASLSGAGLAAIPGQQNHPR